MDEVQALKLSQVRVRRGEFCLQIDSLELASGERVALVGHNGAGKTTLVKIAALLLKPHRGEVRIFGRQAFVSKSLDRGLKQRISVVFAHHGLLSSMSVLDNAALPLQLRGISTKPAKAQAQKWLDAFGAAHLATRRPWELSSGEAQRVALARAFACNPELMLLDEPFARLDPPTKHELLRRLSDVLAESNAAVLFVTHNLEEAALLAERIVVISNGKIEQDASARQVLMSPASPEIASLVGFENRIIGKVQQQKNGLVWIELDHLKLCAVSDLPVNTEVVALFRAEDITLHPTPPAESSALNRFRCRVVAIRQLGARVELDLNAGVRLNAVITNDSLTRLNIKVGSELIAAIKAVAIKVFPVKTCRSTKDDR